MRLTCSLQCKELDLGRAPGRGGGNHRPQSRPSWAVSSGSEGALVSRASALWEEASVPRQPLCQLGPWPSWLPASPGVHPTTSPGSPALVLTEFRSSP